MQQVSKQSALGDGDRLLVSLWARFLIEKGRKSVAASSALVSAIENFALGKPPLCRHIAHYLFTQQRKLFAEKLKKFVIANRWLLESKIRFELCRHWERDSIQKQCEMKRLSATV